MCRDQERQRTHIRLRLFQFDSSQNLDLGEVSVHCQHCAAMHQSGERIVSSTEQSAKFSNCCLKGSYSLTFLSDPPSFLWHLLTGSATHDRRLRNNIRKYNSALPLGAVSASWVNRGPGTSFFYRTITSYGQIYHHLGSLMLASQLRLAFYLCTSQRVSMVLRHNSRQ